MEHATTYDDAFNALHARGAELTRVDDHVIVQADDHTYSVGVDELATFAAADDLTPWQTSPGGATGTAEEASHSLLSLVGDRPGECGRLRAARIIAGYPIPHRDDTEKDELAKYAVQLDWPLREVTRLVDAMIAGRLIVQTPGPRPTLALTRAGFRTLEALDAGRQHAAA